MRCLRSSTCLQLVCGDPASDGGMAGPTDRRGISVERGSGLSGRDNDGAYGQAFRRRIRTMGIRDRPTSPRSLWQNAYAERLIGTLRRDCLDHVLIFGVQHLRHILASYSAYYNQTRTHLSLDKDAPLRRAVQRRGCKLEAICKRPFDLEIAAPRAVDEGAKKLRPDICGRAADASTAPSRRRASETFRFPCASHR
jgi:hypothetical protein